LLEANGSLNLSEPILTPQALEELLFGEKIKLGKLPGKVIHIFGEAGAGKTTLAIQLAVNFCSKNMKVVLIDTEGKITGNRIQQYFQGENFTKINALLKLYQPKSFQEQFWLVNKLEFFLQRQTIGLLIIDTISNFYRQEATSQLKEKKSFKKLAFQVALLREIAHRKNFPVILFNQATMIRKKATEEEEFLAKLNGERIRPVAKAILQYWSDREIILISHGFGKFEARVPTEIKGRVKFEITSKGITPAKN